MLTTITPTCRSWSNISSAAFFLLTCTKLVICLHQPFLSACSAATAQWSTTFKVELTFLPLPSPSVTRSPTTHFVMNVLMWGGPVSRTTCTQFEVKNDLLIKKSCEIMHFILFILSSRDQLGRTSPSVGSRIKYARQRGFVLTQTRCLHRLELNKDKLA